MTHPLVEQLLTGSGLLYLLLALLAIAALLVRRLTQDPHVRRRAILLVGLLLLFALIQITLGEIPERTSGFVTTPGGERVPGLVANPTYQAVSVALLIVGLLALLLIATISIVDFVLVRKLRFEIPNILRDATVFTLFFVGVLMILYSRTDLNVAGLFTTSAVISIVIGLALQDTLGNVFSGLALQTERSFKVSDWVRFGELEGIVTDISWRATKLRTRSNDLVIIPNSLISKDTVVNYSAPTRVHAVTVEIGVHYRHPPADVIAALEEAAEQTEGILKRPRADVRTVAYGDFAVTYDVKYWIKDYEEMEDIKDDFMTLIWYAFKRREIEIPYPIRNLYLHQVTPESRRAEAEADDERVFQHLRRVDLFDPLSESEARALAARARVEMYFGGETVLRQGEPGDSLYIIEDGLVEVVVSQNGRSERLAHLGPSAFFGEMALMTGAERKATVVTVKPTHFFVIDREALRGTLESNPRLAERISETLAQRQQQLEDTHAAMNRIAAQAVDAQKHQILSRIRDFFGFRE
ncbi:MAG TPA: mechanosensitive ion channel family protein [Gemmatimonadota bacterium]|nr:mechanosensitive ion channel family protein [Gemmatimonadota bacterium]